MTLGGFVRRTDNRYRHKYMHSLSPIFMKPYYMMDLSHLPGGDAAMRSSPTSLHILSKPLFFIKDNASDVFIVMKNRLICIHLLNLDPGPVVVRNFFI